MALPAFPGSIYRRQPPRRLHVQLVSRKPCDAKVFRLSLQCMRTAQTLLRRRKVASGADSSWAGLPTVLTVSIRHAPAILSFPGAQLSVERSFRHHLTELLEWGQIFSNPFKVRGLGRVTKPLERPTMVRPANECKANDFGPRTPYKKWCSRPRWPRTNNSRRDMTWRALGDDFRTFLLNPGETISELRA